MLLASNHGASRAHAFSGTMLLCGTDKARRLSQVPREARGLLPPFFQRQRQLLGGLDAIAAIALGLIKRAIGCRAQHLHPLSAQPPPLTAADSGTNPARPR